MNDTFQKSCHVAAVASLLALIILGTLWELWLAPLRPGGSWLVLKVVPLLLPLRGILKRDLYTMQWSSMLILLYFIEGIVRATSVTGIDHGLAPTMAWIEVALVTVFFFSSILYLRPYKRAAKRLAKEAIQKAANSKTYK